MIKTFGLVFLAMFCFVGFFCVFVFCFFVLLRGRVGGVGFGHIWLCLALLLALLGG